MNAAVNIKVTPTETSIIPGLIMIKAPIIPMTTESQRLGSLGSLNKKIAIIDPIIGSINIREVAVTSGTTVTP